MKRLVIITAAIMLAIPMAGFGMDMEGKYGLGYFMSDAPVGGRFWATPQLGIDVGIGLESKTVWMVPVGGGDAEKESAMSLWFEIGFPYIVFPGDRANFFIRPGFQFAQLDDRVYGSGGLDEKWTVMQFTIAPGAEVFFGEHFSLEAAHGIAIEMLSYPDDEDAYGSLAGESETNFYSFGAGVSYLGFHFYFK